jgi:hypothetical protein
VDKNSQYSIRSPHPVPRKRRAVGKMVKIKYVSLGDATPRKLLPFIPFQFLSTKMFNILVQRCIVEKMIGLNTKDKKFLFDRQIRETYCNSSFENQVQECAKNLDHHRINVKHNLQRY